MFVFQLTFILFFSMMSLHSQATPFSDSERDEDPRVQIIDINQVTAAKSVGNLIIKTNRFSKDIQTRCSAVLIAEEYLMTAAHCVFDHLRAAPVMSIEFIPQYLGQGQQRQSRVFVKEGWIHKQYIKNDYKEILQFPNGLVSLHRETRISDLAILKVVNEQSQQGLGKQFGYIKPIGEEQASTTSLPVSLLSYPGDKENNTLWHQECELKKTLPQIGKFNCQVYSGSSGAGILTKTQDSINPRVLGIVSTSSENGYVGEAVLFSNRIIEDINHIITKQHEKVTEFEAVTFNTKSKVYIHIANRCNKEIIAQAYHQPTDTETWGVIEKNIPINSSALFNSINSRIWYSHIRDLDGHIYNLGKDIALSINKKKYFFKKRTVPYRNGYGHIFYGDHFLKIHCI